MMDGSATVNSCGVGEVTISALGLDSTDQRVADLMTEIDRDRSGTIDFDEFVAMMMGVGLHTYIIACRRL